MIKTGGLNPTKMLRPTMLHYVASFPGLLHPKSDPKVPLPWKLPLPKSFYGFMVTMAGAADTAFFIFFLFIGKRSHQGCPWSSSDIQKWDKLTVDVHIII